MKYFILIVLILAADRGTKLLITQNMSPGDSIAVIDGVFHISYIRNHGAAFSILQGQTLLLGIFTALLITAGIVFVFLNRKSEDRMMMCSVCMIIGGGLGNLIDRISVGYVVDFLDFRVFPVFNFADICVTLGCVLMCLCVIRKDSKAKNE